MTEEWTPFGLSDEGRAQYVVLVPGLPSWLKEPVIGWLRRYLTTEDPWVNVSRVLEIQAVTRVDLGTTSEPVKHWDAIVDVLRELQDDQVLRIADYVLSILSHPGGSPSATLDLVLTAGRSKWTAGERFGKAGLVERVPAGVQASVEATVASSGPAGEVLARAWAYVHGLQPNDGAAYADAVRAVEIAAIGQAQPNHSTATLGTVLGQMKSDGDWRLPLREHPDAPGSELIIAMGRALWHGHRDRHGSVDFSDVTHEEARAAVTLAATLVDWFASGAVARRPA